MACSDYSTYFLKHVKQRHINHAWSYRIVFSYLQISLDMCWEKVVGEDRENGVRWIVGGWERFGRLLFRDTAGWPWYSRKVFGPKPAAYFNNRICYQVLTSRRCRAGGVYRLPWLVYSLLYRETTPIRIAPYYIHVEASCQPASGQCGSFEIMCLKIVDESHRGDLGGTEALACHFTKSLFRHRVSL
jgi:hypothetical protein